MWQYQLSHWRTAVPCGPQRWIHSAMLWGSSLRSACYFNPTSEQSTEKRPFCQLNAWGFWNLGWKVELAIVQRLTTVCLGVAPTPRVLHQYHFSR